MSRNKEHRGAAFGGAPNGATAFGGRPLGSVFFVSDHLFFYIMHIYEYSTYFPYLCTYFSNMFHICSFVCFLTYGVNRRKT